MFESFRFISFCLILGSLSFLSNVGFAAQWQENEEIGKIFEQANVEGTFVLYDVIADSFTGYNSERANQRFIPASTFKIANSLIGLASGAIKDVDEILPYGGKPQFLKTWENDMSLRDAIKISNVPIYQELARRIGPKKMQMNLNKLDYGNKNIGNIIDMFWLQGPIKISAIEQVLFLSKLTQNKLPFPTSIQKQVRDITIIEEKDDRILHAKTGWTTASTPGIGWWVGWVVHGEKIYCFALNIDMDNIEDASKRIEIGKASLKLFNIF